MSHTNAFVQRLKGYWAFIGAAISAVGGFATFVIQSLQDPLWTWGLFSVSFIFLSGIAGAAWTAKEAVESPLLTPFGEPHRLSRFVVPTWIQWLLVVMLMLYLPFGIYLAKLPHNTFNSLFIERPEVLFQSTAQIDGKLYHSGGTAYDGENLDDLSPRFFLTHGFYFQFFVQKAPRHKQVTIERLEVELVDFKESDANPKSNVYMTMPFRESNLYLVELDDPKRSGKSKVPCEHYFEWKKDGPNEGHESQRFAAKLLEHDHPEPIILRVEARSPGFYTFNVSLRVSVGSSLEKIAVGKLTVFFAKNDFVPPAE